MKHWILLLSVTMMSAGFFLISLTSTDHELDQSASPLRAKKESEKSRIVSSKIKKSNRSIAAIPSPSLKNKIVYLGLKKEDLVNFPLTNKASTDWEKKFVTNFKTNLEDFLPSSFKIKHKRSIVKKENRSSRKLEHIIVRYQRTDGTPYTFEALVDSQTGSMVQSWNKTRYEQRLPIALDGTNRLLRKTQ